MTAETQIFFHPHQGEVAVKNGFSWPALAWGSLWAVAKRMWFPYFVALLALDALIWFVTGAATERQSPVLALLALALNVGSAVVRGRHGNRWLAASLRSRGYALRGVRPRPAS